MGIFDFFSGKGSSIGKTVAKATNKDAQSVDRFHALEVLRDDGSSEAIAGLLKRFTFVYSKSIDDEQEKQWAHDALVEMASQTPEREAGESDESFAARQSEHENRRATILQEVEQAVVNFDTIAWPLKLLEHVASRDATRSVLEKVIAANDNEYVRDPSRKIQMIDFLGEFSDPRSARALLAYLEDVDEGVRYHAVEALLHQKNEEVAREPLLKLLINEAEESRRIKIRILDGLAELGWVTHGYKGTVEKLCEEIGRGHAIDNKGRIRKPSAH